MSPTIMYQHLSSSEDSIGGGDEKFPKEPLLLRPHWRKPFLVLLGLTGIALTSILSFTLGLHIARQRQSSIDLKWFSPPDDVRITYQYQKHFVVRPGNHTEDPWMALIPHPNGFITHPSLSPEPHGVAVFHQLHCLNGIRRAYWAAVDGNVHHSHIARPSHVRHCIDYLRQALMCHADTNLEPIIPELGGASGFGSEHKCRDFARVKEFVGEWGTVVNGPPIHMSSGENHHGHEEEEEN